MTVNSRPLVTEENLHDEASHVMHALGALKRSMEESGAYEVARKLIQGFEPATDTQIVADMEALRAALYENVPYTQRNEALFPLMEKYLEAREYKQWSQTATIEAIINDHHDTMETWLGGPSGASNLAYLKIAQDNLSQVSFTSDNKAAKKLHDETKKNMGRLQEIFHGELKKHCKEALHALQENTPLVEASQLPFSLDQWNKAIGACKKLLEVEKNLSSREIA